MIDGDCGVKTVYVEPEDDADDSALLRSVVCARSGTLTQSLEALCERRGTAGSDMVDCDTSADSMAGGDPQRTLW